MSKLLAAMSLAAAMFFAAAAHAFNPQPDPPGVYGW
jgi:opacity protein-like surface antigen